MTIEALNESHKAYRKQLTKEALGIGFEQLNLKEVSPIERKNHA
jgi:hypothetical protein